MPHFQSSAEPAYCCHSSKTSRAFPLCLVPERPKRRQSVQRRRSEWLGFSSSASWGEIVPNDGTSEQRRRINDVPGTSLRMPKKLSRLGNGKRPGGSRPLPFTHSNELSFDDRHDFVRARVDDYDLIANQDVVETVPFRIDLNYL